MLIHNQKSCKQFSLLPLFAYADAKREENIKKNYAIIFLQSNFGLTAQRAKLITELQGYPTTNKWGL